MTRKFKPISLEDFKEKIKVIFKYYDENFGFPVKIENDLKKIQFDYENMTGSDSENMTNPNPNSDEDGFATYPVGYLTLPGDLQVFFVNAGGDWEFPICFILYWDGKQIRGYIPTDGNSFNLKSKQAWGNGELDDTADSYAQFESMISKEKLIADICERIQL